VNISKTKKDIPKRKTLFLFTLKSLSNKQQLFFYLVGILNKILYMLPVLDALFEAS